MKSIAIALALALLASLSLTSAHAQVSFDGKAVAFKSASLVPLPPAPAPLLVGTIAKGKKKTILTADATLASGQLAPGAPWTLSMGVDVNGIPMNPGTTYPFSVEQDCSTFWVAGAEGCNLSAEFMIDIDAAEVANPGCCYGVPLTVTLVAGPSLNPFIPGIPVDATLAVRMEKKK